jgi:hypothetical protein
MRTISAIAVVVLGSDNPNHYSGASCLVSIRNHPDLH